MAGFWVNSKYFTILKFFTAFCGRRFLEKNPWPLWSHSEVTPIKNCWDREAGQQLLSIRYITLLNMNNHETLESETGWNWMKLARPKFGFFPTSNSPVPLRCCHATPVRPSLLFQVSALPGRIPIPKCIESVEFHINVYYLLGYHYILGYIYWESLSYI